MFLFNLLQSIYTTQTRLFNLLQSIYTTQTGLFNLLGYNSKRKRKSIIKIKLVFAFAMSADCCIQNGSNAFALIFPPWHVGFGNFPHKCFIHRCCIFVLTH